MNNIEALEIKERKTNEKIDILKKIHNYGTTYQAELVNEMIDEYEATLNNIIEKKERYQKRTRNKALISMIVYKFLLFGGGVFSIFLIFTFLTNNSLHFCNYANSKSFLCGLLVFICIFLILNVYILFEKKAWWIISIIIFIPCISIILKKVTGYDVFGIPSISFALSLYSFLNSLRTDKDFHNENATDNND